MAERETIYALSSGRPPAAIAVIRISGPRAGAALQALTGKLPSPRQAAFARVRDPASSALIDEALALWFPGPRSETGEDIAELQLHGGRAVIAAVLAALSRVAGLRPAEAGEFTRRAFENGKLDLTAVEGLADLVAAETEGQRRQALRQLQGALRVPAEAWREKLIKTLALVEARIDFSDEADVPENLLTPALAMTGSLADEIAGALADGQRGERLREGLVVAIAGPPNAGKSTLLNRLAKREAAIVSPYAGTTRDVIEVHLDLGGWPVTLLDTAGIRETEDPVELEGVKRARARAETADLVLWVVEAGSPLHHAEALGPKPSSKPSLGVQPPRNDENTLKSLNNRQKQPEMWLIHNKIDLCKDAKQNNELKRQNNPKNEAISSPTKPLKNMVKEELAHKNEPSVSKNELEYNISATTGEGLGPLLAHLASHAEGFLAGAESALVTRERHRQVLGDALAALKRAQTPAVASHEDLLAEELRIASRALGRLTGRVDVEDVLDVIFRDFCIGK